MKLIKFLFWLPILTVVVVFVSTNSDKMSFSLWPILPEDTKIGVSGSLAIVSFIFFGYIVAKIDSWFSYSPLRKALSSQKKQNKVLDKKQKELEGTITGLQENISNLKAINHIENVKKSFLSQIKEKFSRK